MRSIPKYFDDFSILLGEANAFDNHLLQRLGQNPRQGQTIAINIVINMVLKVQLEFLTRGTELELFANHELYMAFNYMRHIYQMLIYNRRSAIHGLN